MEFNKKTNIIQIFEYFIKKKKLFVKEETIRYYNSKLSQTKSAFEKLNIVTLADLSENSYLELISYFRFEKKLSNSGINKIISFIKSSLIFFKIESFFLVTKKLKNDSKHFQKLTKNELKSLFNLLKNEKNSSKNNKNYVTLCYFLLDTGLRINEALNIKKKNIDFKKNEILLETTKNGEKVIIPFSFFSKNQLLDLFCENNESDYLFFNFLKSRKLNVNDFLSFLKRKSKKLGFKISSHQFRKSYATFFYEKTKDYNFVQKLLRHKNIKTTQLYIQFDESYYFKKYRKNANIWNKILKL